MHLATIIPLIIAFWFVFNFIILRLVAPHMGFGASVLPKDIPDDMQAEIDKLRNKSSGPKDFLQLSYEYLGSIFISDRLNTITKFHYLFLTLAEAWKKKGYIPCNQSSRIMRIFLIKSGFFTDNDIRRKHSFANLVIHQYLEVKLNGTWIAVDVGEACRGRKIGQHLGIWDLKSKHK